MNEIRNSKVYYLSSTKDPSSVRYIGITRKTLELRLYQHLTDHRKPNTHKVKWIKSVILAGFQVVITLIEDNLTVNESLDKEVYWIKKYREEGYKLTNNTEGAYYNEQGELLYEPIQGRKLTDQHRQNLSRKLKGLHKSREAVNKMLATRIINKTNMKPILQFTKDGEFIKEWDSSRHIERELGINCRYIGANCRGVTKTAKGYVWKFKNKQ